MTRSRPAVALCVARSGEGVEIGRARMVRAVEAASADGASLVVLGEALPTGLVNSDDPDEDLLLGESIPGATTTMLSDVAKRRGVWVAFGILERDGRQLYDSAVIVSSSGEHLSFGGAFVVDANGRVSASLSLGREGRLLVPVSALSAYNTATPRR